MLTKEQFEARRSGIGGSDVAAIARMSNWATPLSVYLNKIGVDKYDPEQNEYAYWGSIMESTLVREFNKRTGKIVTIDKNMHRHPEHSFMIANVDGILSGENAVLECKTASAFSKEWGDEDSDEIPSPYLLQCAHYACVLNVDRVYIAALIGGNTFKIYTYERDSALEERIISIERNFWQNYVEKRIEPPAASVKEAAELFPNANDQPIVCTAELENRIRENQILAKEIEEKIKKLDQCKADIANHMGHCSKLVDVNGKQLATWKNQTTKRFDQKDFEFERPLLYESYKKETVSRVLRVPGIKSFK